MLEGRVVWDPGLLEGDLGDAPHFEISGGAMCQVVVDSDGTTFL